MGHTVSWEMPPKVWREEESGSCACGGSSSTPEYQVVKREENVKYANQIPWSVEHSVPEATGN